MRTYNYRFTWNDKTSRKYLRYYVEAESKETAVTKFEEEKKLSVEKDQVKVIRVVG